MLEDAVSNAHRGAAVHTDDDGGRGECYHGGRDGRHRVCPVEHQDGCRDGRHRVCPVEHQDGCQIGRHHLLAVVPDVVEAVAAPAAVVEAVAAPAAVVEAVAAPAAVVEAVAAPVVVAVAAVGLEDAVAVVFVAPRAKAGLPALTAE